MAEQCRQRVGGEDRAGRARGRAAAAERDRVVGVAQREMEVVQHHDDGLAVVMRKARDHVERGDLMDEVEMRRRLVEQDEVGVLRQDGRQRDPAPLAAGE